MNTMTHNGYSARVEFDAEGRIFVGHVAGIQDIVGFHGESVDELEAAFRKGRGRLPGGLQEPQTGATQASLQRVMRGKKCIEKP